MTSQFRPAYLALALIPITSVFAFLGFSGDRSEALPAAMPPAGAESAPDTALAKPTASEARLDTVPAGAQVGEEACANASAHHPLDPTRDELVSHCDASLGGSMYVNDVLDYMLQFSELKLEPYPDLDYEDSGALAYKLSDTPAGTEARVLVGLEPFQVEGGECRYMRMEVDIVGEEGKLVDGAIRYSPRVDLNIAYRTNDPQQPARFALNVQRPVALADSRDSGINAYEGRWTQGSYYWIDLENTTAEPLSGTYGIIDSQPYGMSKFEGVQPLRGDIQLNQDKVTELLEQLQTHLATIQGK